MTKAELYKLVSNLKAQFRITDFDYPMNIFNFCSRTSNVKIEAVPFKTRDLRGMVSLARNDNENNVILVNSNKSFKEQNFHGFHELIHIPTVNEHGTILRCYERIRPNQDSYLEWLANEGAAEFLVPYKVILPMIKNNYNDLIKGLGTYNFCSKYASVFSVTPTVMQYRLDSLKYEISQYLGGTPLDKIEILSNKKQRERGICVKSLIDMENERFHAMWKISNNSTKNDVTIQAT